ncbi:MAG TPA: tetratricopeptide repeat protein [Armatimonadota bacterium]|nr:tetratricopeptide repeat protein [Armatimonadota bacterium]
MKPGRVFAAAACKASQSIITSRGERRRLAALLLLLLLAMAAYPLTARLRRLPVKAPPAKDAAASRPRRAAASAAKAPTAPALTPHELRALIAATRKRHPSDLNGLLYLAYLEVNAGEYAEALLHVDQAAHRYPKNDRPLIALAELMSVTGYKDRAMEALQRAAKVNPKDSLPHIYLSALQTDLGWSQAAVREAQTASKVAPGDPAAAIALAQALYNAALWSQAVAATRRAVQLSPKDYHLWLLLGQVYSEVGMKQYEEASQALQRALQLNRSDPIVLGALGNLERDWDRPDHLKRAESDYQREMQLDPDSMNAAQGLAACYAEKGQVKRAIRLLEEKLHSVPARSIPLGFKFQLGQLYMRDGQISRGRRLLVEYQKRFTPTADVRADQIAGIRIAIAPQETASYYRMGMVLLHHGMADSAIVDLREALRREPANKEYRSALVKALLAQGRTSDARRIAHNLPLKDVTQLRPT